MKDIKEVVKKCEIVEKVSQKSGNTYLAIELELTSGYKETLFPSRAISEMIKLLRK